MNQLILQLKIFSYIQVAFVLVVVNLGPDIILRVVFDLSYFAFFIAHFQSKIHFNIPIQVLSHHAFHLQTVSFLIH